MESTVGKLEQKVKSEGLTEANLRKFWKLVNRAKLEEHLTENILDRIEMLHDVFFREFYPPLFSLRKGLALTAVAMLAGTLLIGNALQSSQPILFLAGSALVLLGTHPWGHWVVGKCVGVSYEYFYLNGPAKLEPSLKIHYRSYLKASFDSRMVVHASGALTTALTALLLLVSALTIQDLWIQSIATVIFFAVIVTEIISWSGMATGDLRRARREKTLKNINKRKRR